MNRKKLKIANLAARGLFAVCLMTNILLSTEAKATEANTTQSPSKLALGNVKVIKSTGEAWAYSKPAAETKTRIVDGKFLQSKNFISTTKNSKVLLLFDNGSIVEVGPETEFSIQEFTVSPFDPKVLNYQTLKNEPTQSSTRLEVTKGTITTKIPKLSPKSSFGIQTPLGTAGIRGTIVSVNVSQEASTFVVTEGAIEVTRNDQTFFIMQGENNTGGNTTKGTQNNPVVISTDPNYTPPAQLVASLSQQAQVFSNSLAQNISPNAMSGAPTQSQADSANTEGQSAQDASSTADVSGPETSGQGIPPALPAPFGGGGGGGTSGGGTIYSR